MCSPALPNRLDVYKRQGHYSSARTDGAVSLTAGVTYTFGGKRFVSCGAQVDQNAINEELNRYRSELSKAQSDLADAKNALANVKPCLLYTSTLYFLSGLAFKILAASCMLTIP